MGVKDELLRRLPQIALAAMAAKQGGLPGATGYLQGVNQGGLMRDQLARQDALDAQRAEYHQAQMANLDADNARQAENLQQQKFARALELIQRASETQAATATDPEAAAAAIQQAATSASGAFGLPQDQLTPFVPNVAPQISARKKKQAADLYARAEKRYNPKGENPEWETSITLQTGDQFGDITPAQLRELFDAPAVDASGAAALPPKAKRALLILDLGGKRVVVDPEQLQPGQEFQETPPVTAGGGTDSEPLVAIMGPDGAPVLVPRREAVGKRPASTREQGRPVQSGDANRIIDLDTSLNELDALEKELGTTGAASKIGAALPNVVTEYTGWGMDAKKRQGTIDLVKQIIGKALEGGVLRKEDEYKYVKILPTIGDPPEVAKSKLLGLRRELQSRRAITLEGLTDAGFDTSKFSSGGSAPVAPAAADPSADPLGLFK